MCAAGGDEGGCHDEIQEVHRRYGGSTGMLLVVAGPAAAADPPGRRASVKGLTNALIKQTAATDGVGEGLANVDLQNNLAQSPGQPGVTPGGGGGGCVTC